MEEIIEIRFKNIEMRLPESRESLDQARKLLNLFEETLPPKIITKSTKVSVSAVPDEYNFQECEKFDKSDLVAHKAGRSTYWLSEGKGVCIEREGYAQGHVYVTIDDLKYLQTHPEQITRVSKTKRYHITGFLKDVDLSVIEIRFKDIEMRLPESKEAIARARKLLELFEETLPPKTITKSTKPKKANPDKSIVSVSAVPDGYNFHECEKFDKSNLPAHKAGKSTYWLSEGKGVCIEREGYAQGLHVYVTIDDLKYLQTHPEQITRVSKTKRYHITGFLKDVDLSGEQTAEIKEPEQEQDQQETKPEEPKKPKLEFFQEDIGFDYRAVQPKQVGRTQVYSNPNGKIVIKVAREIVLTTNDAIETLLQYDEKELTSSLRGINSQKQNILRVYLMELKKRRGLTANGNR